MFFVGDGEPPPLGAAAADTGLFFVGVFVREALAALAFVGSANDEPLVGDARPATAGSETENDVLLLGEGSGIFDGEACEDAWCSPLIFCFFAGLLPAVIGPTPNENNFFCVSAEE